MKDLEQFASDLDRCLIKNIDKIINPANFDLLGIYKKRIFTRGSRDVEFNKLKTGSDSPDSLGFYSAGYARIRRKKGRKTSEVNLQFTDELFNSIKVKQLKPNIVGIQIQGESNLKKAQYIEELYASYGFNSVFNYSDEAQKRYLKAVEKAMNEQLRKCVN